MARPARRSNKAAVDELEEVYRRRSRLRLSASREDIAEGACFLASVTTSKSTGDIVNVGAGDALSFTC